MGLSMEEKKEGKEKKRNAKISHPSTNYVYGDGVPVLPVAALVVPAKTVGLVEVGVLLRARLEVLLLGLLAEGVGAGGGPLEGDVVGRGADETNDAGAAAPVEVPAGEERAVLRLLGPLSVRETGSGEGGIARCWGGVAEREVADLEAALVGDGMGRV